MSALQDEIREAIRPIAQHLNRLEKIMRAHGVGSTSEQVPISEACKILDISRATLTREVKAGKFKSIRVGRKYFIRREDVYSALPPPDELNHKNM